jgi:hypothetical protein
VQSPAGGASQQKQSIGSSGAGLSWPTPDPPGSGSNSPAGRGANRKAQSSGGAQNSRQAPSSDLGMSPPRSAKRAGGPANVASGAAAQSMGGGAATRNGGRRESFSEEIDQLLHGELSDGVRAYLGGKLGGYSFLGGREELKEGRNKRKGGIEQIEGWEEGTV